MKILESVWKRLEESSNSLAGLNSSLTSWEESQRILNMFAYLKNLQTVPKNLDRVLNKSERVLTNREPVWEN